MRYVTLPPSPILADAVEMFWAYDGYQPPHAFERVFPSGTVELLLNLVDGRLRCHDPQTGRLTTKWNGILVTGVHHSFQLVDTAQQYSMLGVALRPGGMWRLFGISTDELTDQHASLDAILGSTARRWTERLCEMDDHTQRLRLLDAEFSRMKPRAMHPAVSWAAGQFIQYPDSLRIGPLAEEAGMSTRRLNELFRREIGIAPKAFARIRRFQSTLQRLRQPRATRISLLAQELGYADQAHLIREFKELSGFTPMQFTAIDPESLCHVPHPQQDQMCPVFMNGE